MHDVFALLISLVSILFFAKIFGEIALKLGQSAIIGELVAGIIIGPSVLGLVYETESLSALSEIGAIILLFEVGLSTNVKEFLKAGFLSTVVAIVGVILPYFLGYFVFLYFGFTDLQAIFAGATLTATSVGITARVFMDFKKLETQEARIVLGAAIIDDVIGLTILAVVLKLVQGGSVTFGTVASISGSAILFLVLAVISGILIAPSVFKIVSLMKQTNVVFAMGIAFCFIISAFSVKVGLAPIIGAFVAGLVLSTIKEGEEIKRDIKPVYAFFVPIFFVLMGTSVDISILNPFVAANRESMFLIAVLFFTAFIGKSASGFVIFKKNIDKFVIGVSMVPRGEVGLIFAGIGLKNNIFNIKNYSALVAVIMLTTFITPIILKPLLSRQKSNIPVK